MVVARVMILDPILDATRSVLPVIVEADSDDAPILDTCAVDPNNDETCMVLTSNVDPLNEERFIVLVVILELMIEHTDKVDACRVEAVNDPV
jgi:hypothetical protein